MFVAYSCKFSQRYAWPIVLDATKKLFPQFATVTLKLRHLKSKILFLNCSQAKIFWYTKFCLVTLKTLSQVNPRLEKTEIRGISTHQINFVDLCQGQNLTSCDTDEQTHSASTVMDILCTAIPLIYTHDMYSYIVQLTARHDCSELQ